MSRVADFYRPDIDGLRAVAVVPVVLFHAGFPYITGGFVGVDIFFVISGFLITGIIAREVEAGKFSLGQFYARRARRIFPALTVVVLATLFAGYLVLDPRRFAGLGESAATIAVFGSNIYFWKSISYFDPGIQPLLHTWSLAVEEQYYMLFPLLLLMLRFRRSWRSAALAVIFLLSLALSVALVATKPSAAFYLLPSRAWELMLGGLLALHQFGAPKSEGHARFASALGLTLILVPMFAYTPSTAFPGLAALPPAAGAALAIWGRGWGLSWRPLVAMGLVSYSFYLWHLPLIDFVKYLTDAPLSPLMAAMAFLASLGLATLTYRYVETPFREGRDKRRLTQLAAFGMPVLAAAGLCIASLDGLPSRLSAIQAKQLEMSGDEALHPSRCMTLDDRWVDPRKPCRFGARPRILLWGDSHAMVTASSLRAARISFLFAADADCPIGKDLAISQSHEKGLTHFGHYRKCGDYNRLMLGRALQSDIDTVILSSRWTNWRIGEPANPAENSVDVRLLDRYGVSADGSENRVKFERAFTELVGELTQAGKKVVIVGPLPEPSVNVPHRLYVSSFGFAPPPSPITDYRTRHRAILAFFSRFKGRKDVSFIWPADALCRQNSCATVDDNVPLYFDHNHLTVAAANSLSPLYRTLR